MAQSGGVPQLGGHNYEFVDEVPDRLKCSICLLPLKDPMQIAQCGHRFCKRCLDPLLRKVEKGPTFAATLGLLRQFPAQTAKCPIDRKSFQMDKVFEDTACQREVEDWHVRCPSQGCPWSGELRALKDHEAKCSFALVNCNNDGCKEKVRRSGLSRHRTTDCKWRTITCCFCRGQYPWISSQAHNDKCKHYPLPCVNSCGKRNIPRNQMTEHVKSVCPAVSVSCKYEHVGCRVKIRRDALQNHVKANMEKHLDLACAKLSQLEKKTDERLDVVYAKLERLEDRIKTTTDRPRSSDPRVIGKKYRRRYSPSPSP